MKSIEIFIIFSISAKFPKICTTIIALIWRLLDLLINTPLSKIHSSLQNRSNLSESIVSESSQSMKTGWALQYFTGFTAAINVNVGTIINLRKVDFGGVELTNVKASVVRNQKAPLLLGQSILGRLGKIEIDNSQKILRITQQ